ncbi:uncharacterized protein LOC143245526 [Tachypleus tridentatus]|uniref:uncharacterized protein LOC143245526 n=1 Tax=Tachypleus tridentatus TaxID=6853 RepID=UPI003FD558B5
MDFPGVQSTALLDHSFQKERSELSQKGSLGKRRRPSRANIRAFVSSVFNDHEEEVPTEWSTSNRQDTCKPREGQNERSLERKPVLPKHAVVVLPVGLMTSRRKTGKDEQSSGAKKEIFDSRTNNYCTSSTSVLQGGLRSVILQGGGVTTITISGDSTAARHKIHPESYPITADDSKNEQVCVRIHGNQEVPESTSSVNILSGKRCIGSKEDIIEGKYPMFC